MIKIAYCIAGTRHSGGMERVLANKANWLVSHGYEVAVITTDQHGEPSYFKMDPAIKHYDLGINYEDNNGKPFHKKLFSYLLKQILHRKRLRSILKQIRPDITISMFCNDADILHRIKDGSKKILEIHFSRFKRMQYGRKGIWKLADLLLSHKDIITATRYKKFVVLTEEDKRYWGNLPNMEVIPNAATLKVKPEYDCDSKKVIAVGRFNYQKGYDRLVMAWKKVADKHPGWTLHIYGDGKHEEINLIIEALDLEQSVYLHESTGDIASKYQESSFLVMSSRYEGLPMVLIEAQSCGLPLVSFDCKCGPKDIIEEGVNGFLVKEGDIDGLSEAISNLIESRELRLRMSLASIAMTASFEEDAIMKRWEHLFNSLL